MTRAGEKDVPPFRTKRFASSGGKWYFITREGQEGPFDSYLEAENECIFYISTLSTYKNFGVEAPKKRNHHGVEYEIFRDMVDTVD